MKLKVGWLKESTLVYSLVQVGSDNLKLIVLKSYSTWVLKGGWRGKSRD